MSQYDRRVKRSRVYPSHDELRERFDYDPETGKLVWKFCKIQRFVGKEAGTVARTITYQHQRKKAYRLVGIGKQIYPAHRLIWILVNGKIPEGMQIDHIDGDGLNNRIENLRLVTPLEQSRNRARPMNNTSGAMGVRRSHDRRYWDAWIGTKMIGTFGSFREAEERVKSERMRLGYHENHGRD